MARCSQCETEGATKKCSSCKQAFYCSKECQKAHFRMHKKECAQLAQGGPSHLSSTCTRVSLLRYSSPASFVAITVVGWAASAVLLQTSAALAQCEVRLIVCRRFDGGCWRTRAANDSCC